MRNRSAKNAGNISIYEFSIKTSGRVRIVATYHRAKAFIQFQGKVSSCEKMKNKLD